MIMQNEIFFMKLHIKSYMEGNKCRDYYYYYYLESAVQGRDLVSESTISLQRPQPHTTNPWKKEKDKIVGDKKERADHDNRKAFALLLKPASLTPSNTGSL